MKSGPRSIARHRPSRPKVCFLRRMQDLEVQMAYPVIEADLRGGPGIEVDLEELYTAMLLELQGGLR